MIHHFKVFSMQCYIIALLTKIVYQAKASCIKRISYFMTIVYMHSHYQKPPATCLYFFMFRTIWISNTPNTLMGDKISLFYRNMINFLPPTARCL